MKDELNRLQDEYVIEVSFFTKIIILTLCLMLAFFRLYDSYRNSDVIEFVIFGIYLGIAIGVYLFMQNQKVILRPSGIVQRRLFSTKETSWKNVMGCKQSRYLYVTARNDDGADEEIRIASRGSNIDMEEAKKLVEMFMEKYGKL